MRRLYEGFCGKALFLTILNADCEKIVVENPVPSKIFDFPKYSQTIQPYEYDELNEHPYSKKTCLWIKGNVPLLVPTTPNRRPSATWCPSGSYSHKHSDKHKGMFTKDRARNRSKTFSGIAKAMAEQWG